MVCPEMGHESVAFMGVFDGTVGSFAADFVHAHIAATLIEAQVRLRAAPRPTLVRPGSRPSTAGCAHSHGALMPAASYRSQDFPALQRAEGAPFERLRRLSESVLRETFAAVDKALLRACEERGGLGYASSTGVVALVAHGVLTLAHVGDSKVRGSCAWRACRRRSGPTHRSPLAAQIVLATEISPEEPLCATSLTVDHKPDQEAELRRIERVRAARQIRTGSAPPCAAHSPPPPAPLQAGGCLTYLHGGKPFIRGGDFTQRQALGERPMQLNYSRAFGGKDLKQCDCPPRPPAPRPSPQCVSPQLRPDRGAGRDQHARTAQAPHAAARVGRGVGRAQPGGGGRLRGDRSV